MSSRIGYMEEACYAADGTAVRHGDVLRDMIVEDEADVRVLGMIGFTDAQITRTKLYNGTAPLAYMVVWYDGEIMLNKVRYMDPSVKVYGLDVDLAGVKQAIRLEMFGHTALSIVTMSGG